MINETNKAPMVNITGAKCPISGAVLMMALSNGTSRYSLNLSQLDGARGSGDTEEDARLGAAPEAGAEVAILLSIYRDS